jgi:predicted aconitase
LRDTFMRLTSEEKKMLRGGNGVAAKEALELQIEVGKFLAPNAWCRCPTFI